jgi:hypothetical protein
MKKLIVCLLVMLAPIHMCYAILPPLYQSVEEIKAILKDKRLSEVLSSSNTITNIIKIDNGYSIETEDSSVVVDVIYIPTKLLGPAKFKLEFHKANE